MSDGMIGYGSTVRIGRGATPVFSEVKLVGDLDLPGQTADTVEVTHMKSPGRRKQFIAGLIDSGEISVPVNHIPGSETDVLLREILTSGEEVLLEITLGVSTVTDTFVAILTGYARSAPVNDKMTATATFQLSGLVENATDPGSTEGED
ncbi:phage tail protein [Sinirhodobacter populi]|uniref:Phage tail protein n=1 Tax=Paenirhodobacter populi TaxID=2306993 RepID=A0A443KEW5_9RHOB|nr:phage tail tube protein [Sinirhodobacter populi]RWR31354.1 phage tail protein [Sinirhodobacter populi]